MRFLGGLILGGALGFLVGRRAEELRSLVSSGGATSDAAETLTRAELYERARAADIQGRSTMTKDELRDALAAEKPSIATKIAQTVSGREPDATER